MRARSCVLGLGSEVGTDAEAHEIAIGLGCGIVIYPPAVETSGRSRRHPPRSQRPSPILCATRISYVRRRFLLAAPFRSKQSGIKHFGSAPNSRPALGRWATSMQMRGLARTTSMIAFAGRSGVKRRDDRATTVWHLVDAAIFLLLLHETLPLLVLGRTGCTSATVSRHTRRASPRAVL